MSKKIFLLFLLLCSSNIYSINYKLLLDEISNNKISLSLSMLILGIVSWQVLRDSGCDEIIDHSQPKKEKPKSFWFRSGKDKDSNKEDKQNK